MSSSQPVSDGRADLDRLPPRQRPPGQPATECLAFEKLHNGIGDRALHTVVVDSENVWMRQRRNCSDLALEACFSSGVVGKGFRQDFDGDLAAQACITGAV